MKGSSGRVHRILVFVRLSAISVLFMSNPAENDARKCSASSKEQQKEQDVQDVAMAHRYRLSLTILPTQSSFRVVALIFYDGPTTSVTFPAADIRSEDDSRRYVVGTNDEPGGNIGGSICAERAALVQLRFLPQVKVTKIVIVTDHEQPISPGMLCREFMAGHSSVSFEVPIVLAGSGRRENGWTCTITTLRQLYPYPSPYARLTASQANTLGKSLSDEAVTITTGQTSRRSLSDSTVLQLMAAAHKASLKDTRIGLHPIQFGAAVLFDDDTIVASHQKKALEYGATLDAVSQLAPLIERSNAHPTALVQVDSFGVAHAPFASARAFLSEHGYGNCCVLVHRYRQEDESLECETNSIHLSDLVEVLVSDLAPVAPDMGDLWSC